jgi:hypothetical protein
MGNCNVPGYFLQITDVENIDTGIAGTPSPLHEGNLEKNDFSVSYAVAALSAISEEQHCFSRTLCWNCWFRIAPEHLEIKFPDTMPGSFFISWYRCLLPCYM